MPGSPAQIDESLQELLRAWPNTPALVYNRQLDVLACNTLAGSLYSGFTRRDNLARMTFLDSHAHNFFVDWERAATNCAANLRLSMGHASSAPHARAIVAEIHQRSEQFRAIWERGEVRGKSHDSQTFCHPEVGQLELSFQAFDVRTSPGHQLVVYHAPQGSSASDKLQLLGALAVSRH